jgi:hypothetical protein
MVASFLSARDPGATGLLFSFGKDRRDLRALLTGQRRRLIDGPTHLLGQIPSLERLVCRDELSVAGTPGTAERSQVSTLGSPGLMHERQR